jgi:hypothetical protein
LFKKISLMAFFFLFLPSLHAEVIELAEGFTIDLDHVKEILAPCPSQGGYPVPGDSCIKRCYGGVNTSNNTIKCLLDAIGYFYEVFTMNTPTGPQSWQTGNRMVTRDLRSVYAFPNSEVNVCFNFGNSVVGTWKYSKATIEERSCTIEN